MKKLYNTYISLFLVVLFSCENTPFDELNNDPTALTEVDLNLMLPEVLSSSMFNEGGGGPRAIGIIMQQFIGLDAQQIDYTQYILGTDLLNNYWRGGLYAGVLRSCDVMIKQAQQEDAPFYEAVGKVVMANQYGISTSYFGSMPFTEALQGAEVFQPKYDTQEAVYMGVIQMLDEAITILSGEPIGYAGGDLIYDGNVKRWLKTAKALKARFLMHQTKRNSSNYSAALTELGGAYTSIEEQSDFQFETAQISNYSLAKFGIERPSTLGIDSRFAEMMKGDPRRPFYMFQDGDGVWQYFGSDANLPYSKSDAKIPMISFAEVKFMEAEALLETGADPAMALKEAIVASFDQCGADGGEAYADAVITEGIDKETIIVEAYKAYYGTAFHETWVNYRRTGFPVLEANPNGSNGFNPSGVVPKRFLYPDSEFQTNMENVTAAQKAQDGALLDVALWAFE
ncbi:SusD/RagB family nutrient-binding outer membrane lipoprotein [Echinicola soli]|nr:SusD/RagB family nutrient-binding outer membrane lipoprotein [Echinicola soli]